METYLEIFFAKQKVINENHHTTHEERKISFRVWKMKSYKDITRKSILYSFSHCKNLFIYLFIFYHKWNILVFRVKYYSMSIIKN